MSNTVVLQTSLDAYSVRRGKVRDMYDFGDQMLMVSTDRISAFDYVLPTGIPDKGKVLTQISAFWFELLEQPHHMISMDLSSIELTDEQKTELSGRSMLVKKAEVVPIECVVRGYLVGSGWKEYQRDGKVCGIPLPAGLEQAAKLDEPIFSPSTKAETGHDENITFQQMVDIVGQAVADDLRERSLDIYKRGADYAAEKGIIIADTKFEFGKIGDEIILVDEVLTPDSSRFWPASQYRPGQNPPSYDKQFVRDWLEEAGWDKNSDPPELPGDVVSQTREKYVEAYEQLTGSKFV